MLASLTERFDIRFGAIVVLSRPKLIAAIVLSLVFAIPMVTLVSAMVVFPLLFFGAIGLFANVAPLILIAAAGLRRLGLRALGLRALGLRPTTGRLLEQWQFFAIVWIGCAYGLSHWGDAGSSIGARNIPYLKVLFAPYVYALGYPIE